MADKALFQGGGLRIQEAEDRPQMEWALPSPSYCGDRRENHLSSGWCLKGKNEHALCFCFFGFRPKSEILVQETHIHRNVTNRSGSKPLSGETQVRDDS